MSFFHLWLRKYSRGSTNYVRMERYCLGVDILCFLLLLPHLLLRYWLAAQMREVFILKKNPNFFIWICSEATEEELYALHIVSNFPNGVSFLVWISSDLSSKCARQ
jgi:hypothetical protein